MTCYPEYTGSLLPLMFPVHNPLDWTLSIVDGCVQLTQWPGPDAAPTPEQVIAYHDGPEYLAHVRRTRIVSLDAERLPRLEAAGWSAADREDALAGLPTPAVTAHLQAERQAVAAAYAAARSAIEAADTIAAVEAINPIWPALTGPDGAQS